MTENSGKKTAARPAAVGMLRARDEATGVLLKHEADEGRLYVSRGTSGYYFCATCDAAGRDPYVSGRGVSMDLPAWMRKAYKSEAV